MKKVLYLAAALSVAPLLFVFAQQPRAGAANADADAGEPIKVDVDVVSLYCAVRNKQNGLVNTLEKGDFDLAEDGKPQTIKYFSKETDFRSPSDCW